MPFRYNKYNLIQWGNQKQSLLILIIIGVLCSCKSPNFTPMDYPNAKITFGSGGGLTGATIETIILDNGQVFRKSALNQELTELKKISPKLCKEIFSKCKTLDLNNQKKGPLSDQYRFIKFSENGKEFTYAWGTQNNQSIQNEIREYFNFLRMTIKTINS